MSARRAARATEISLAGGSSRALIPRDANHPSAATVASPRTANACQRSFSARFIG